MRHSCQRKRRAAEGTMTVIRLLLVLFIVSAPTAALADQRSDVYRQAKAATVLVAAIDDASHSLSFGSGFLVDQDGLFVTNAHVIEGSTRLFVYVGDETVFTGSKPVATDPDLDLTAVRIQPVRADPLVLTPEVPREGTETISVGYPRITDILQMGFTLHPTIVPGTVNGTVQGPSRSRGRFAAFIQTTGHIHSGSSGGPLVSLESGQVVGMVVMTVPYLERAKDRNGGVVGNVMMRTGIGYAIPAPIIRQWLMDNHLLSTVAPAPAPAKRSEGREVIESRMVPSAGRSFATGHLLQTIASVLPTDPDLFNLAIYHFEAAAALKPEDTRLLAHLGAAYVSVGRLDDAIKAFHQALQSDPGSTPAAYQLGLALEAQGLREEALTTWERFLELPTAGDSDGCRQKMQQAIARLKPLSKAK